MFAFVHAAESPRLLKDGWKVYSAEREYERLGVPKSRLWEIVDINKDYKFSETYPRIVSFFLLENRFFWCRFTLVNPHQTLFFRNFI